MCVEGESPTTNNFLNTRAKALSCKEDNEPNGSLSIPRFASAQFRFWRYEVQPKAS